MKRTLQFAGILLALLLCAGSITTVDLGRQVIGTLGLTNGGTGNSSYVKGEYHTACTGAVTAAATRFALVGFGSSTTACTGVSAAVGGTKIPTAGTIKNLFFNSSVAGIASDKVQLLKNGSTTGAPTCTYGTSTTCNDVSTALTVAAGDVITISYTSGTSDLSANLSVSFELWN